MEEEFESFLSKICFRIEGGSEPGGMRERAIER